MVCCLLGYTVLLYVILNASKKKGKVATASGHNCNEHLLFNARIRLGNPQNDPVLS